MPDSSPAVSTKTTKSELVPNRGWVRICLLLGSDFAHNSSSKKCFFENKTHGAGRCPTSCGRNVHFPLAPPAEKRVYCPYRCGESRCVGGVITCAGAKERQLLCTAVFFTFWSYYTVSAPRYQYTDFTNIWVQICWNWQYRQGKQNTLYWCYQ